LYITHAGFLPLSKPEPIDSIRLHCLRLLAVLRTARIRMLSELLW
jgi:hypothetical protein